LDVVFEAEGALHTDSIIAIVFRIESPWRD
jgi:hypothetical protein